MWRFERCVRNVKLVKLLDYAGGFLLHASDLNSLSLYFILLLLPSFYRVCILISSNIYARIYIVTRVAASLLALESHSSWNKFISDLRD